jgi:thiol:disulfide interchange protein
MSAIGFNLAGLFEIGTLTSGSSLQDKKGPVGDFWTGVLAAFIATPCTGPFMATALGAALVLPIGIAFVIFAGLGFGMALPFLIVGFIPALRTRLPKPGSWMATARRILSVPMFITVLGLVWVLMRQSNNDYVLSVLAATMLSTFGLWVTGIWQYSQRKGKWWPSILLTLVPLYAVIYLMPSTPSTTPQHEISSNVISFEQDKLTELRSKQDVFLYFTADWCLTCKVNEKTSIDRDEVKAAFTQHNVVTMVGDWTNGNTLITQFLSQHGRSGVPLYLWYKKGVDKPQILPQILSPSILMEQVTN